MQEINCTVEAERIAFRGYGMLLAEIGLPPGADVDRASLEKARELSELKSRFVSMASHEFRTPLSTILSSTYLIEKYSTH